MDTIVYIDGLNLYYGCLKDTENKWVDLKKLAQKAIGRNVLGNEVIITKIKYFTAIVKPTSTDPNVSKRQRLYLKALKEHIPEIEIIYGHFSEHIVNMRLAEPQGNTYFTDVIKREEKGSDVNLALHFLNDALRDEYECGVIISNDSDLAEAVRLVSSQTNKTIGIVSPYKKVSKKLARHSNFQRTIRRNALKNYQLPETIPNTEIRKPQQW